MRIRKSSQILFPPCSGRPSCVHRRPGAWCEARRPLAQFYIPRGSSDCLSRSSQGNRAGFWAVCIHVCVEGVVYRAVQMKWGWGQQTLA